MSKLIVDDVEVDVPPEYTLLQACEEAGLRFRAFAFMSGCRSPAIAGCVLSK